MGTPLAMFPARRPLGERFGGSFFRQVPEAPGVYLLCGAGEGVLYVGKAKNLRRRLGQYRSANPDRLPRKLRRLLVAVERILWDECASEAAAVARERELLQTLRPRFNTVGVRPARLDWLGWRMVSGGLQLGCGEVTDDWTERYGPFGQCRFLHGALLRLLWWGLGRRDSTEEPGWMRLPAALAAERSPRQWTFTTDAGASAGVSGRLQSFFREGDLDLIEWCLEAAPASRFERGWIERDAVCLLEVYERLSAPDDAAEPVH